MAQTGYTPISIYYSATATNTPTAGNLVAGELAINTADGKLFYKDSSGVVQTIASKNGVAGGSNTQVLYNSSGSLAGSANMTFSGTALTLANDASISGLTVGKGYGSQANNTVLGVLGLSSSSLTGNYNTALGYGTLSANTSAQFNTAVGMQSLRDNTTGESNTAIGGYQALIVNTTGSYNTAVGTGSLAANTTASNNTAVGYQAGYSLTTGSNNVLMGYYGGIGGAGSGLTTATANTFIGPSAGYLVTTGSKNTFLGAFSGNSGSLDLRTASNYIVLSDGDGNPRAYHNATNWYQSNNSTLWSITSDERIKKNIKPLENGLSVILALQPKEFDYIVTNLHDIGFIAQEYENVLPLQITEQDSSGQYAELTNGEKIKGIQQNLVPYLVKAIQELKAEFDAYKATHP